MNLHGCINGIGRWIRSQWKIFLALFVVLGCVCSASMMSYEPIHADDTTDMIDPDHDGDVDYDKDHATEVGTGVLENMLISLYSAKITMFGMPIDFANLPNSIDRFIDFESMQHIVAGGAQQSSNDDSKTGKVAGTPRDDSSDVAATQGITLFSFFKNTIFPIAQGLGTTLLTLMLLWKYIKECLEVERFTWERALMIFAKCFIVNMFIAGSFDILCMFAETAGNLMNSIVFTDPEIVGIGEALADAVTNTTSWI